MKIILVRHGDPDYEKDCLTELGHKQAAAAAQRLLDEGIDEIYSSSHGRARQTAEYFSKASGISKIQILDFIKEIRFGCEGELYNNKWNPWLGCVDLIRKGYNLQDPDWRNFPVFKNNYATEDADKIGEETDKWLSSLGYEREGVYYRCKCKDAKEKTLAVFCHGGASAAFLARVLNQTFPYMCGTLLHFPHTTITVLNFENAKDSLVLPIVELMNDARHIKNV